MKASLYTSAQVVTERLLATRHRLAVKLIAERTDPDNPPTEKQATYLADLVARASSSPLVDNDLGEGPLTKKRAQELITKLTGPRKGRR